MAAEGVGNAGRSELHSGVIFPLKLLYTNTPENCRFFSAAMVAPNAFRRSLRTRWFQLAVVEELDTYSVRLEYDAAARH